MTQAIKILIIDDDVDYANYLADVIQMQNWPCTITA